MLRCPAAPRFVSFPFQVAALHGVATDAHDCRLFCSKAEVASDPTIRKLVQEQTAQWSEMVERHRKEEWKAMKQHVADQEEILKQLLTTTQASQVRQLEGKHER